MMNKREARKAGRQAGLAAASWVFDGNTKDEMYRRVLNGLEDGDPEVFDAIAAPSWLSGEWAGESISEILGESSGDDDRDDEIAGLYEQAADTAYYHEIERVARYHTKGKK